MTLGRPTLRIVVTFQIVGVSAHMGSNGIGYLSIGLAISYHVDGLFIHCVSGKKTLVTVYDIHD